MSSRYLAPVSYRKLLVAALQGLLFQSAKGYRGGRSKLYRTAKEAVARALQYAYRDRRVKKRDFRRLWIVRINAAARKHGLNVVLTSESLAGFRNNTAISRATFAATGIWKEPGDSPEAHLKDIIAGGRLINDRTLVATMTTIKRQIHAVPRPIQSMKWSILSAADAARPPDVASFPVMIPQTQPGSFWRLAP